MPVNHIVFGIINNLCGTFNLSEPTIKQVSLRPHSN